MAIFQKLSVNSFKTKKIEFASELYMQGLLLTNPELLCLKDEYDEEDIPEILNIEFNISGIGRTDIIANYYKDYIAIIELKNKKIGVREVQQLANYLNKKDIIEKKINEKNTLISKGLEWFGLLIAPNIDDDAKKLIEKLNSIKKNNKIGVIILKVFQTDNDQTFITTDYLFIEKLINKKNYDKYIFDSNVYNKRRLVLAAIKYWVARQKGITVKKLIDAFPNTIQENFDCVKNIEDIKDLHRYFCSSEELILITERGKNYQMAVCNQWGIKNIDNFINHFNNALKPKQKINSKTK